MRVTIYHRCRSFATGSAWSASGYLVYWWAEIELPAGVSWSFRFIGLWDPDERPDLERTITSNLGANPADLARAEQDARWEGPDL